MDANLILHLPFDDPDGNKACDYTQYRNDASLSDGASFSKDGKIGKSITFNVTGECTTERTIPISADFTLSLWIKSKESKIGWLLSMPGIDNYKEQWLDVLPGEWNFFAFIKDGNRFIAYKNDSRIFDDTLPNTPDGFSINDYSLFGTKAEIDDVKLFNKAMTAREVFELQKETDVEYYIDGKNFKEYGVYVSNSAGLVGGLERKESLQVEWDNYHGVVRDKKRPRYKERTITLDCFIEASGRSAFVQWVNLFLDLFRKEGNHRLKVEYDGNTKPLVYEVECIDGVDVDKTWGQYSNELMVGKFKLKLIEDEPVKKVLRHIGGAANSVANIKVTSSKLLNIYWGDGTHTYDVSGVEQEITHTYEWPGEYDIIVTGVIEDIELFETNAIVLWEILK